MALSCVHERTVCEQSGACVRCAGAGSAVPCRCAAPVTARSRSADRDHHADRSCCRTSGGRGPWATRAARRAAVRYTVAPHRRRGSRPSHRVVAHGRVLRRDRHRGARSRRHRPRERPGGNGDDRTGGRRAPQPPAAQLALLGVRHRRRVLGGRGRGPRSDRFHRRPHGRSVARPRCDRTSRLRVLRRRPRRAHPCP